MIRLFARPDTVCIYKCVAFFFFKEWSRFLEPSMDPETVKLALHIIIFNKLPMFQKNEDIVAPLILGDQLVVECLMSQCHYNWNCMITSKVPLLLYRPIDLWKQEPIRLQGWQLDYSKSAQYFTVQCANKGHFSPAWVVSVAIYFYNGSIS